MEVSAIKHASDGFWWFTYWKMGLFVFLNYENNKSPRTLGGQPRPGGQRSFSSPASPTSSPIFSVLTSLKGISQGFRPRPRCLQEPDIHGTFPPTECPTPSLRARPRTGSDSDINNLPVTLISNQAAFTTSGGPNSVYFRQINAPILSEFFPASGFANTKINRSTYTVSTALATLLMGRETWETSLRFWWEMISAVGSTFSRRPSTPIGILCYGIIQIVK